MEFVSDLGRDSFYFITLVLIGMAFPVSRTIYYSLIYALAFFVYGLGKNIYSEGRPFFLDSNIEPIGECTASFGSPSGHSTIATAWIMAIWFDIFETKYKSWQSIVGLALSVYYFSTMMFARVVVGMHSLN